MTTVVFHDVEGAVRTWARAQTDISAVVANRVYFAVPDGGVFPLITVAAVGGLVDRYVPVDQALIQFDCWGASERDKTGAEAAARAVQQAVWNLTPDTPMGSAVAMGAEVESRPIWSPDQDTGRARYVVTCSFAIRATG